MRKQPSDDKWTWLDGSPDEGTNWSSDLSDNTTSPMCVGVAGSFADNRFYFSNKACDAEYTFLCEYNSMYKPPQNINVRSSPTSKSCNNIYRNASICQIFFSKSQYARNQVDGAEEPTINKFFNIEIFINQLFQNRPYYFQTTLYKICFKNE